MFSKLQEDAARIDMDIGTLESKLPEVMYGYTETNPDPRPILDRRSRESSQIEKEMRAILADFNAFEKLLDENSDATAEEERFLQNLAQELNLEHCLVLDDETDGKRIHIILKSSELFFVSLRKYFIGNSSRKYFSRHSSSRYVDLRSLN